MGIFIFTVLGHMALIRCDKPPIAWFALETQQEWRCLVFAHDGHIAEWRNDLGRKRLMPIGLVKAHVHGQLLHCSKQEGLQPKPEP